MVTFPRKKPNKSSVCSSTGTSFATGFPRFVITTVSRFAWTSSIRAKQWTLNEPAAIFLTIRLLRSWSLYHSQEGLILWQQRGLIRRCGDSWYQPPHFRSSRLTRSYGLFPIHGGSVLHCADPGGAA